MRSSHKHQGPSLEGNIGKISALELAENTDRNPAAKKILIIEDNDFVAALIKDFLNAHLQEGDLEIYDTVSGNAGIDIAKAIQPDLIILDIVLPDRSGVEVYNQLERHPGTSRTKFIILSGKVGFEPQKAIFLKKPFKGDEFITIVKRLLEI